MREFLIKIGEAMLWFAGYIQPTNNPTTEQECYRMGLFIFIISCTAMFLLLVLGVMTIIEKIFFKEEIPDEDRYK